MILNVGAVSLDFHARYKFHLVCHGIQTQYICVTNPVCNAATTVPDLSSLIVLNLYL